MDQKGLFPSVNIFCIFTSSVCVCVCVCVLLIHAHVQCNLILYFSETSHLSGLGEVAYFASNEDDPYITIKNVRVYVKSFAT